MKYFSQFLLLSTILFGSLIAETNAQIKAAGFHNVDITQDLCDHIDQRGFSSEESYEVIAELLNPTGLTFKGKVFECENLKNKAVAFIDNGVRIIAYDAAFLESVRNENDWSAKGILAHELAHHLMDHNMDEDNYLLMRLEELEADEWAGFALGKLGANKEEVVSMLDHISHPSCAAERHASHPCKSKRTEAILKGWQSTQPAKKIIEVTSDEENRTIEELATGLAYYESKQYKEAFPIYYKYRFDKNFDNKHQHALGWMYDVGKGVSQDNEKAIYWYEQACEDEGLEFMLKLGQRYTGFERYTGGENFPINFEKGMYWIEKAANTGYINAMNELAIIYLHFRGGNYWGTPIDYIKGKYWLEKVAEKGMGIAMLRLGTLYQEGKGTQQDYMKAKYWYEQAVKAGDTRAWFKMGDLYGLGEGVPKDSKMAIQWFEKACEAGEARNMEELGNRYRDGKVIPKDYDKAIYWYEKSCEAGGTYYMEKLGSKYREGEEIPQDYAKAKYWYEKAAEKGNIFAMVDLGDMYDKGEGVSQDFKKAIFWYKKAAKDGSSKAQEKLTSMGESW